MDQLYIRELSDCDRVSVTPSQSETYSSLNESRGLILENLDGTYCQGLNAKGQKDCDNNSEPDQWRFTDYPHNRILYIVDDDEIAFYSGVFELPTHIDDFVHLFLKHQRCFSVFITFLLFLEATLNVFAYINRDKAIDQVIKVPLYSLMYQLMRTYRSSDQKALREIYFSAICINITYMAVYYTMGWFAVYRRSVKLYGWFSTLSLIGIVLEMVLAYANRFELTMFLMRFAGFVYSRFINQLLVSLLLLPR